ADYIHQEIKELLTREEILWRQRSRIQWLKEDALSMFSETHCCKVVEIVIPELDEMRTIHVVSIGSEAAASLTPDLQDREGYELHWILALTLLFSTHLQLQIMSLPNASGPDKFITQISERDVEFCKSEMKLQCRHNSRICELALPASKRPKQQDVPKRARLRESIRQN
ncbi:hypothetical protein Tco_1022385, partial [Tanacetum coccineum]